MSAPEQDRSRPGVDAPRPPRYIDALLDDFDADGRHRWNHLGHWDEPWEATLGSRVDAQRRMNEILLGLAGVVDGRAVLDVGCGFGGTLEAIDAQHRDMDLVGLDIDDRQLRICRRLTADATNSLLWIQGDACALPLADATFDAAISIEALWHVPSRRSFFAEAARVLRRPGALAVVDLFVQPEAPSAMAMHRDELFAILRSGFAPWPELDATPEGVVELAAAAGLDAVAVIDATEQTVPSYLDHGDSVQRPGAATYSSNEGVQLFVELHRRHLLKVVYLAFELRPMAQNSS